MSRTNERTDKIILATVIMLSTVFVAGTIGLNNLFGENLDIALHDSFFVVPKFKILVLVNSIVLYVSFLVRQLRFGFRTNLGNYVLTISASIPPPWFVSSRINNLKV